MAISSIMAELDKFQTFSTNTGKSMETFTTSLRTTQNGLSPMLGMSGLPSANSARTFYISVSEQLGSFLQDVGSGLNALTQGAVTIGANYAGADLDSAAQMNVVDSTFNPKPGDETTQQQETEAQESEPGDDTTGSTLPPADDMTPDDSDPTTNGTESGTALNEATAHQRYDAENGNGEREVWNKDPEQD